MLYAIRDTERASRIFHLSDNLAWIRKELAAFNRDYSPTRRYCLVKLTDEVVAALIATDGRGALRDLKTVKEWELRECPDIQPRLVSKNVIAHLQMHGLLETRGMSDGWMFLTGFGCELANSIILFSQEEQNS